MQTLAAGMSVTIENARLFEAEQQPRCRACSGQHGQLCPGQRAEPGRALINLVGEQTHAIFNADIAYVALLDKSHGLINFPYTHGEDLTAVRDGEGLQPASSCKPTARC